MASIHSEPVVAVVVAAGSGVRLGGTGPKALRLVGGVPLIRHSIDMLARCGVRHVVVTVPDGAQAAFEDALAGAALAHRLVLGGRERQDSVRLGLEALGGLSPRGDIVLVHDAARPLVPDEVTFAVIKAVRAGAVAAVPVVPVVDTIRQLGPGASSTLIDRSRLRAVQTPQGFQRAELLEAHRLVHTEGILVTDDAAACEAAGHQVVLVNGSYESVKITTVADLALAETILATRPQTPFGEP